MTHHYSESQITTYIQQAKEAIKNIKDNSSLVSLIERSIKIAKNKTYPIEKRLNTIKKALSLLTDDDSEYT